jgi:hypothetical protein
MVSSPIGFRPPELAVFVRTIESVSIRAAAFGLVTVLKFPNVFGKVSINLKTGEAFRNPVIVFGSTSIGSNASLSVSQR